MLDAARAPTSVASALFTFAVSAASWLVSALSVFFSGAVPLAPDKLGRIVIPQSLRAYAALENEVVLAGVHSRVEIWSRQTWDEQQAIVEDQSSSIANTIAEHMASLGI